MKRVQLVMAAAVAAWSACSSKKPTSDAGAAAVIDLKGFDGGPPDEEALRSGKRTGMAGDRPEVATEALIRSLFASRIPWHRFVDPKHGIVELRMAAGDDRAGDEFGRRCGADIDRVLAAHAAHITADLAQTEFGHELTCNNLALFFADPDGAAPHAICSFDSDVAYAVSHDLLFVPDAQLGLRLVGITAIPGDSVDDAALDQFGAEVAKTGRLCP